ncbi:MAG: hypothetical protein ABIG60_03005 [Patescibacteria group bacterium]
MNNKDLSQIVLNKIKEKKINPKPKWEFILKNYTFWGVFVMSIIIGSLASSVLIHMMINNDWDLLREFSNNRLEFIFLTLPYIWFIILVLFITLAYYNFKHIKSGYRYKFEIIILASIIISILCGSLFYIIGFGQAIEYTFRENVPTYNMLMSPRDRVWLNPDKGLLIGKVINIESEENFNLEDLNLKIWQIMAEEAALGCHLELKLGYRVKVIGEKVNESQFRALIVRPFLSEPMQFFIRTNAPVNSRPACR